MAGAIALVAASLAGAGPAGALLPVPSAADQLALMPLPHSAYGSDAAALKLDTDSSGVFDNAKAADKTTDTTDSAASLQAAGRITGYRLTFDDLGSLNKPGKIVSAYSVLTLYQDARAAHRGLKRQLDDVTTSDPSSGFRVTSSSRFGAPGLGQEATGIRAQAKAGLVWLWFTGVLTRRGELVELLAIVRTDATPANAAALDLAHALADRVDGVLAGTITTPPAKLPSQAPKGTVAPPVEISAGALTSGDLNGAKVTRAEYVKDPDVVSAYEREFDAAKYGKTHFLSVESDVSLHSSAGDQSAYLTGIASVFDPSNPNFKSFITKSFSKGAGFKVTELTVLRHEPIKLQDTTGGDLIIRVVTPFGPVQAAYAFIGNARFSGLLIVTSAIGTSIGFGDLVRLEASFARRIRAAKANLR